jgi:hypothetical protein
MESDMRKHHQGFEGRIVQVIDGPFTGFRGEVKEVNEQTVKVDVQTYRRSRQWTWRLGRSNWCQKFQTETLPTFDLEADLACGAHFDSAFEFAKRRC